MNALASIKEEQTEKFGTNVTTIRIVLHAIHIFYC